MFYKKENHAKLAHIRPNIHVFCRLNRRDCQIGDERIEF